MKLITLCLLLFVTGFTSAKTSEENRRRLNWEASLQTGYDYRAEVTQLMFSKYIGRTELVGLKVGMTTDGARDPKQTNVALQYKKFAGNSFYFAPELYYLNYFENDQTDNSFLLFPDENERFSAVGVGIRFGNQWQWENFTLGVDWFGIGGNFIYWRHDEEIFDMPVTWTLLNLHLGWAF